MPHVRTLVMGTPKSAKQRFFSKVKKSSPGNCWMWIGAKSGKYGTIWIDGKHVRAHRFSYLLHTGSIPAGKIVMHSCDNPMCVNPKHLCCGTQRENLLDCVKKKRHWSFTSPEKAASGKRNGAYTHPESVRRGEFVNTAKLKPRQVLEIRKRLSVGDNYEILAKDYSLDPSTIAKIHKRKTWRHI